MRIHYLSQFRTLPPDNAAVIAAQAAKDTVELAKQNARVDQRAWVAVAENLELINRYRVTVCSLYYIDRARFLAMSGKRQFFTGGKDADSLPIGSLKLRFAWKDEGCFRKIHFSRASACICLSVKPRASVKMANGLPASGVRVKTSS
jgi:hypothetical protein